MANKICPKCQGQLIKDVDTDEYVCLMCDSRFRVNKKSKTSSVSNENTNSEASVVDNSQGNELHVQNNADEDAASAAAFSSDFSLDTELPANDTAGNIDAQDMSSFDAMFGTTNEEALDVDLSNFDAMFGTTNEEVSDVDLANFDAMFGTTNEEASDVDLSNFDVMFGTTNSETSDVNIADIDSIISQVENSTSTPVQVSTNVNVPDIDSITYQAENSVSTPVQVSTSMAAKQESVPAQEESYDIAFDDETSLTADIDYLLKTANIILDKNNKDVSGFVKLMNKTYNEHPNCSDEELAKLLDIVTEKADQNYMSSYVNAINSIIARARQKQEMDRKNQEYQEAVDSSSVELENIFNSYNEKNYNKADYSKIKSYYSQHKEKLEMITVYDDYNERTKEIVNDFTRTSKSVKTKAQKTKAAIIKVAAGVSALIIMIAVLIIGAQPRISYETVDKYDYMYQLSSDLDSENVEIAKLSYSNSSNVKVVTGIKGLFLPFHFSMNEVNIPEYVNGDAVVGIAADAFSGNTDIEKVTLPEMLWKIDNYAFFHCTNLTTVRYTSGEEVYEDSLPSNLKYVGENVFTGTNLSSITISNVIDYVGYDAFDVSNEEFIIYYAGTKDQWNEISQTVYTKINYDKVTIKFYTYNELYTSKVINKGSTTSIIPHEEKGYNFNGYYLANNTKVFDSNGSQVYTINQDISVYASLTPIKYNITYITNGASLDTSINNYTIEDSNINLNYIKPIKNGYTFNGWYTNSNYSSASKITQINTNDCSDVTLYAKFTANTYTIYIEDFDVKVIYDSQGGSQVSTQILDSTGEYISIPDDPTKEGYIFTGWYTDINCNNYYSFNDPVTSDLVLYAGWMSESSLYKNDCIEEYLIDEVNYNNSSYSWNDYLNTNYTRLTFVVDKASSPDISYKKNSSYSSYEMLIYNETTKSVLSTITCSSSYYYSSTISAKPGDVISVYLRSLNDTAQCYLYFYGFSSNYSNAYLQRLDNVIATYDKNYSLPILSNAAGNFLGYYTQNDGMGTKLTNAYGNSIKNYNFTQSITAYPHFDYTYYSISYYDGSNKIYPSGSTSSYNVDDYVSLVDASKTGYKFEGWYLNKEFTGEEYYSIPTGSIGNRTFYAKFTPNEYTVTLDGLKSSYTVSFDSNGGTTISDQELENGDTITIPTNPTRSGYVFKGWYSDEECTEYYDFTDDIIKDLTLYAGWESTSTFYYTSCYSTNTFNPANYYSSSTASSWYINSSSYSSYPYRYSFVMNETTTSSNPMYMYYRYYSNYYYFLIYNETTNSTIKTNTYVNSTSYYSTPIVANAGDVISIYMYDSSYSAYAYLYFTNYNTLTSEGSVEDVSTSTVIYNESYKLYVKEVPGYRFEGYYTSSNGTGTKLTDISGNSINPWTYTSNMTVYPYYIEAPYTIEYEANGGTTTDTYVYSYEYQDPDIILPILSKTGYTFAGWYESSDFSGDSVSIIESGDYGNKKFYAKFTPNQYDLTLDGITNSIIVMFNSNGGTDVANQELEYGDSITIPTNPTRSGYMFKGWYSDEECTEYYDFTDDITEDLTLYAGWANPSAFYFTNIYSSNTFNPADYTSSSDYLYVTISSSSYSSYRYRYSFVMNETTTSSNPMYVYYKNGYSSSTSYSYYIFIYNETTNTTILSNTSVSNYNSYYSASVVANAGDVISIYMYDYSNTTYANLYFTNYSAVISTGQNSIDDSIYTVTYDSSYILPVEERNGYTFNGYYTESNGTGTKLTDEEGNSLANWTGLADITVYPYYQAITYNITYDKDNGTETDEYLDYTYETTYTADDEDITLPILEKTGYTFNGWYQTEDYSDTAITSIVSGSYGDKDLYAKFTPNQYDLTLDGITKTITVTFNSNGGTDVSSQELEYGDSITIPTNPTRSGYMFRGWFTDEECTEYYDFTDDITEDLTLYAGWEDTTTFYYTSCYNTNTFNPANYYSSSYKTSWTISYNTSSTYRNRYSFVMNETTTSSNPMYMYYRYYSNYYYFFIYNETTNSTIKTNTYVNSTSYYSTSIVANAGDVISIYLYNTYSSSSSYAYMYFTNYNTLTSTGVCDNDAYLYNSGTSTDYTVTYDSSYELPVVERNGYTFNGYYTESNGSGTKLTDEDANSLVNWTGLTDITAYPYYQAITYNITYDKDNGTEVDTDYVYETTYTVEDEDIQLPELEKTGYTFNGWYQTEDYSDTPIMTIVSGSYGDKDLYAKFTPNQYDLALDGLSSSDIIVSFESNAGTTISDQELSIGDSITIPTNPTRSGYMFRGWYSDEECTEYYDFTDDITEDLTLYAGWEDTSTFYYTSCYGIATFNPTSYTSSETASSWYISSSSYSSYPYRYSFVMNETTTEDNPMNIYYKYNSSYYSYYFYIYNETTNTNAQSSILVSNYSSYYSTSVIANAGDVISIYMYDYGSTTYANMYFTNYNALESTGLCNTANYSYDSTTSTDYTVTYDSSYELPVEERNGYTFNGYYTESNGTGTKLTDEEGNSLANWTGLADITVYPYYQAITYNITYDKDNGTEVDTDYVYETIYTADDDDITLPILEKTGYTFNGWYQTEDYSDTAITAIVSGSYGDKDLYAKFTPNEYTLTLDSIFDPSIVTFETNGGSTISSQKLEYGDTITIPTNPTKTGYIFAGWYSDEECTEYYDFTADITENLTLYAKWVAPGSYYSLISVGSSATVYAEGQTEKYLPFVPLVSQTITVYSSSSFDTYGLLYDINKTKLTYNDDGNGRNFYFTYSVTAGNLYYIAARAYSSSVSGTMTVYLNGTALPTSTGIFDVYVDGYAYDETKNSAHTVEYDSSYELPVVERNGYTFNGYYTESNGTGTKLTDEDANSLVNWTGLTDITAYPYYQAITYNITYDKDNGTEVDTDYVYETTYTVEDEDIQLPELEKTGYTFDGWYQTEDYSDTSITSIVSGSYGDKTLYAKFTPNEYTLTLDAGENAYLDFTVTFMDGDSVYATQSISYNESIDYVIPSKTGYLFKGWYTDSDLTTKYDFTTNITSNLVLYANWVSEEETICLVGSSAAINVIGTTIDYIAFIPLVSETITISSAGGVDTTGYLYSSDKSTTIAYDYDSGSGSNFSITYAVTAGNVYYIGVCGNSSSDIGYNISISIQGTQEPVVTGVNSGIQTYEMTITYGTEFTLLSATLDDMAFEGWLNGTDSITSGVWTYTTDLTLTAVYTVE